MPLRIAPKGVATRRSTEVLAVEDPRVGDALRYIQENYFGGNLSVDEVVAHCGIPRRSLERAFRQELQRTVLHEILRMRISHAQKLLEDNFVLGDRYRGTVRICESEPFFLGISWADRGHAKSLSIGSPTYALTQRSQLTTRAVRSPAAISHWPRGWGRADGRAPASVHLESAEMKVNMP
jgi:hypothetical protein